jgi:poly(ADP-ribose) glycohydrolase ARH3
MNRNDLADATQDRLAGALLGTALGDALGRPFEGRRRVSRPEVAALVRSDAPLRWTDDTHMAIALAESLVANGGEVDPQHLGDTFAAAYHDEPWRGYAGGPPRVFALAQQGKSYEEAAASLYEGGSYGNGGAMRCAPIAMVAAPDLDRAALLAAAQARTTHAHPLGVDGAVLLACGIVQAVTVSADQDWTEGLVDQVASRLSSTSMEERLRAIGSDLPDATALLGLARDFGSGVAALESVPSALAVFLARRHDPVEAITEAILLGHDTDTVGAMAGALGGAHHGLARLPRRLLERLEQRDRLERLARELAALAR